jgi:hypothetical protein
MKSSGRPHLARIAAVTGLPRSEVKKLVDPDYKLSAKGPDYFPRALRVLNAWESAETYLRQGKPRQLKIRGQTPSFESLCKDYSGDIPYTVILDDLERRHRIVVSRAQDTVSIVNSRKRNDRISRDHSMLVFAAAFLTDALQRDSALVRRRQGISSSANVSDAYVENAIASRLTDLLDQLPELFAKPKLRKRNIVNVYTLVTRSKQKM